ncbi:hypothetical protein V502_10450 [Pseudogymnoascus sp. VKM F-4520 (FW-2644)]|nr:hypothetical protein V502_10450 [Pseudogymnoascus sp. VKM F-4520 (FW-2644)]
MGETTRYRRGYLEHLMLRIKFDDHDCTVCQSKEDDETIRRNNEVFSRALWDLLFILSKWIGFVRSRRQYGVILELGAYSPGDCKHTFRDFHLQENYPYQESYDTEPTADAYKLRIKRLGLDTLNDPYHGWVNGRQEGLSLGSKQRIMGTSNIDDDLLKPSICPYTFPKVEIITCLLTRRHFYRKIGAKSLEKLLHYTRLLLHGIPSTLRELSIFEDFNKLLHPEHFKQLTNLEQYTKRANPSLGKALSKSSRLLTRLSAAFLVDAVDFFASFGPTNNPNANVIPWQNLQLLALTSRLLHPKTAYRNINGMLIAAGRAAASMPKLRVMEIWNCGRRHACVFRYTNTDGKARISWECIWGPGFQLDPDVINCLANVPRQGQHPHGNFTATVNLKVWRQRNMKTYGSIICHLELCVGVQHFLSFFLMLWEDFPYPKSSTPA